MEKEISFKNRDRLIQLGIVIAALRRIRGMSQEQLADKAGISRSTVSTIEAPGVARNFSMDAFYNIADALQVEPGDLINSALFPDDIINKSKK